MKVKRFEDTDYYFDDCAVCQYVKEMEKKGKLQTESELKTAFEKQRQKGAVVGGSMFEEDNKKN